MDLPGILSEFKSALHKMQTLRHLAQDHLKYKEKPFKKKAG